MPQTLPQTWTTAQAAFIVEKPIDAFQKTLERAPVKPKLLRRGGRRVRMFELRDLVFLRALDSLRRDLTTKTQAEIYTALMRAPLDGGARTIEIGPLTYDLDPHFRFIEAKVEAARELSELIDASGYEPLIKGTTIEAYRIASLLDGMDLAEILQDYPSLEERQVRAAQAYAAANPKVGRPFPKVTAKKALRTARAPDADAFMPPRE